MTLSCSSYPARELQATSSKEWKRNVMTKMRNVTMLLKENCHSTRDQLISIRQERGRIVRQKMASRKGHGSDRSPHYEHMAGCWARSGDVMPMLIWRPSRSRFFYTSLSLLSHISFTLCLSPPLTFPSYPPSPSFINPTLPQIPTILPPSLRPSIPPPSSPPDLDLLPERNIRAQWVSAGWA